MALNLINSVPMPGMIFSLRYRSPYLFSTYMAGFFGAAPSYLIAYTYDPSGVLSQAGEIYTLLSGDGLSIVGFDDDGNLFCTSNIDGVPTLMVFSFNGTAFTLLDSIGLDIWYIVDANMCFPNKVVHCGSVYILPGELNMFVFGWDGTNLSSISSLPTDPGMYTAEKYSDEIVMAVSSWGASAINAFRLNGGNLTEIAATAEGGGMGQIQIVNDIVFAFPCSDKVCAYTFSEDTFTLVDDLVVDCSGGLTFIKHTGNGYFIVGDSYNFTQQFDIVKFDFTSNEFSHIQTVEMGVFNYIQGASVIDCIADFSSATSGIVGTPIEFTNLSTRKTIAFPRSDFDHADTTTVCDFYDSGETFSYLWSFGDGGTSTEEYPSHTYNTSGTFTVSLTVSDIWGNDIETKTGYITIESPGYTIDEDDYYKRIQPIRTEELVNHIEITVSPLVLGDVAQVYRSNNSETFSASETRTIQVLYTDTPVKFAVATLTDKSEEALIITNAEYLAWGADITIFNASGVTATCKIVITGRVLESAGEQAVVRTDEESIREYGIRKYVMPKNHLIQNVTIAEAIADGLLAVYARTRKDVVLDWRGNPALELGDIVRVPEYRSPSLTIYGTFQIFKNQLNYDGGLRAGLEARRYYDVE